MPIKSGIGFGEAQVYNTGNLVNSYGKILAQQAKEREKFDADLADTMAKYSTKGLKEGDVKLTAESYKALKDRVTKYDTNNPTERAKAMMEAKNGIQTIQDYSDSAKTAYANLDNISSDVLEHPWKYKPEARETIKQLYANPYATWSDDYKDLNKTKFEREPDLSSVDKLFRTVNSDLRQESKDKGQFKVGSVGNYVTSTYFATPEQAQAKLLSGIEATPEAKYTLAKAYNEAYPDKKDYTPLDLANFATDMYKKSLGDSAFSFYGDKNLKPKATSSGDESLNPANFEVINNKTFNTSELRKGNKTIPGKPIITFDKFVTTPVQQPFATPQIQNAFNISEGRPESIGSKKGLKITGIGSKNGNIRVTVVDDSENEYYLKPEDIPATIRNGKQYKAAINALGGASKQSSSSKTFNVDEYLKEKKIKK